MDKSIVASISSIGKVLNMKTIADYVENGEILGIIREMGIDYAQGYHISMPVPITQWQPVAKTSAQPGKRRCINTLPLTTPIRFAGSY